MDGSDALYEIRCGDVLWCVDFSPQTQTIPGRLAWPGFGPSGKGGNEIDPSPRVFYRCTYLYLLCTARIIIHHRHNASTVYMVRIESNARRRRSADRG